MVIAKPMEETDAKKNIQDSALSGINQTLADTDRWSKMQDGLSNTGKLRQKLAQEQRDKQSRLLQASTDSNLATSEALNNLINGGSSLTSSALNRQADVQGANIQADNNNVFARMADSIEADDSATQENRVLDVNTMVRPDVKFREADIKNRLAVANAQANASDNAASKKMTSALGGAAGAIAGSSLIPAFGPAGPIIGGTLGGIFGGFLG